MVIVGHRRRRQRLTFTMFQAPRPAGRAIRGPACITPARVRQPRATLRPETLNLRSTPVENRRSCLRARPSSKAFGLENLRWRRRESNPRPRTHREEPLQACPAIGFRPPAGSQAAYRRASHPLESRSGRLALPRRQARCWRRIPSHGPKTERRRYLTRLGGECEIVLRTCVVPGCFTRPTGDLGLQLIRRTDHVETRSPPDSEL